VGGRSHRQARPDVLDDGHERVLLDAEHAQAQALVQGLAAAGQHRATQLRAQPPVGLCARTRHPQTPQNVRGRQMRFAVLVTRHVYSQTGTLEQQRVTPSTFAKGEACVLYLQ
jgi:hypothetical protein